MLRHKILVAIAKLLYKDKGKLDPKEEDLKYYTPNVYLSSNNITSEILRLGLNKEEFVLVLLDDNFLRVHRIIPALAGGHLIKYLIDESFEDLRRLSEPPR